MFLLNIYEKKTYRSGNVYGMKTRGKDDIFVT